MENVPSHFAHTNGYSSQLTCKLTRIGHDWLLRTPSSAASSRQPPSGRRSRAQPHLTPAFLRRTVHHNLTRNISLTHKFGTVTHIGLLILFLRPTWNWLFEWDVGHSQPYAPQSNGERGCCANGERVTRLRKPKQGRSKRNERPRT